MVSGTCMDISHIGDATVNTPNCPILLKNILYVPRTRKNLVSIHRLTVDNSIIVKFYHFFLIKDQQTKTILLKGRCIGGLYPLPLYEIKQACSAARCPISTWHSCLGHASNRIVEQIISPIMCPAHTCINKMALLNTNITTLLKLVCPSLLMHMYLSNFGMKHSKWQHT
jgi:hypothetical protein